jgi:hypothetical protein
MLGRLTLAAATTIVLVLALEGVVRLAGFGVHNHLIEAARYGAMLEQDEGGYPRPLRNSSFRSEGVDMVFNSLGMRDIEPVLPKPPGITRVLLLGDSVVVGPLVEQDEIAASRLRALLAGRPMDVTTAAVSGWNTVFEELFVAANIDRLNPDVIVLVYVDNDNELALPFDRAREAPKTAGQRMYRWLLVNSRLFEWAVYVYRERYPDWAGLGRMAERDKARAEAGEPFSLTDKGWLESRAALERIAVAAKEHGAGFVIVLFRYAHAELSDRVLARLTEFSETHGVPVVDGMTWYQGRVPALYFVTPFDSHPNAEGQDRLARGILTLLEPEGPLLRGRETAAATTR